MTEQRKRMQELNMLMALRSDYRSELLDELAKVNADLIAFNEEMKQLKDKGE